MHAQCVIAEFESMDRAKVAVEVLEKNSFTGEEVSLAWRGHDDALKDVDEPQAGDTDDKHDVADSAAIGALIAGGMAIPVSIGTLMVPVMVAGPLLAAAAGGALGSLFSEARHWGVHEHAAKEFEQRIADGSVLLIVNGSDAKLDEAESLLKTTSPKELERFERGTE